MKQERRNHFDYIKTLNLAKPKEKDDKRRTTGAFFKWSSKEGTSLGVGTAKLPVPEAKIHVETSGNRQP